MNIDFLKKKYYLISFEQEESIVLPQNLIDEGFILARIDETMSKCINLNNLCSLTIEFLETYQNKLKIKHDLMNKYCNLYFSLIGTNEDITIYVKINGVDREHILSLNLNDKNFDSILENLNSKIKAVVDHPEKLFCCSKCNKISYKENKTDSKINKLLEEVDFFLKFRAFAGYYCNHCVENDRDIKYEFEQFIKMGDRYFD